MLAAFAAAASVSGLAWPMLATAETQSVGVVRYPVTIDKSCRTGSARIYDECGSQKDIFASALKQAGRMGKALLVSYGAEWCIWCHVFDAYLDGQYENFEYEFDGQKGSLREHGDASIAEQAGLLHRYAADNFVIAHIEAKYSKDGDQVLDHAGALDHFSGSLPFIFVVTPRGRWAGTFDYREAETRREGQDWFRGYDREKLLAQLKVLRAAATTA